MESITIKVNDEMAAEIEKAMHPNYTTKTEFIRDALRLKLEEIKKTESWKELHQFLGKSKRKTTDEELHQAREEVFQKMMKERGLD
ncbi:MAG: ribbon-helix-helix domain-containing protein [Candidatus Woesearchaeota archaeon]|jgi:Arc/MetJ-type ribon-helix-helix transcriptional regulator|nr:ribbon-helix-helix domain-containing protein [Candidatus Woesearchaeota archaeon]